MTTVYILDLKMVDEADAQAIEFQRVGDFMHARTFDANDCIIQERKMIVTDARVFCRGLLKSGKALGIREVSR